jgi:hypothetical protein
MSRESLAVFPVPWELLAAAGATPRFIRFEYVDITGDLGGLPAWSGVDARPARLLAAARSLDPDGRAMVWSGGAADLKEIHGALQAELGDSRVASFPYPLTPDRGLLAFELERMAAALGSPDLSGARAVFSRDQERRGPLWAWDARQGDEAPFPSEAYLAALARWARWPMLPTAPELPDPESGAERAARLRVGLVGASELVTDVGARVEILGGRVVYDEWRAAAAFTRPSDDLVSRYTDLHLAYGLTARAEALRAVERERRLDGWLVITSPFGASNLERVAFTRTLGRPALALEVQDAGALDEAGRLRLEAFFQRLRDGSRA